MTELTTDYALRIERELGGMAARMNAIEGAQTSVRADLRDGLDRIDKNVEKQVAHIRGELQRQADFMTKDRSELREILRTNQTLIREDVETQLKEADRQRNKDRLWLIVGVGAVLIGGSKGIDILIGAMAP